MSENLRIENIENLENENIIASLELMDISWIYKEREKLRGRNEYFGELDESQLFNNYVFEKDTEEILKKSDAARSSLLEIGNHDQVTFRHSIAAILLAEKVISSSEKLGLQLGAEERKLLVEACASHDWGKKYIARTVLNKPERLNANERELMEQHPVYTAYELICKKRPDLAFIDIRHHAIQERNAYPTNEKITEVLPLYASQEDLTGYDLARKESLLKITRVLAIIDEVDALLSDDRVYRFEGMYPEQVRDILNSRYPESKKLIDFLITNWREAEVRGKK